MTKRAAEVNEGSHDSAGRGFVTIALAKVWFVLTSYGIHFTLPRLLGSPEAFGRFSTAMSVASILNNVLIASTIMTVSRFTSLREEAHRVTLRRALWIQLGVGLVLSSGLATAAPFLAKNWLQDASLTPLVRIVSVVVAAYALYAAFVGSLNGRRMFLAQARLDGVFSTVRLLGILSGATLFVSLQLGPGEVGALSGFASASLFILAAAAFRLGPGEAGDAASTPSFSRWFQFLAPIALYQFFLNGILLGDLLILKGTIASLAQETGMDASGAAELASSKVGVYSAAQKFAFVPYQLMIAMTFIVFPMITKAIAASDRGLAQHTLRTAFRTALIILMAVAAPISGAASGVLHLAFPDAYAAGASALEILVFGAAAFALFVISATAHSGAGRPLLAAGFAASGLVAVVLLNLALVRSAGVHGAMVKAAAVATTSGMLLALALSGVALARRFGAFLSVQTVARVALAAVIGWWVTHTLPQSHAGWTVLTMTAGGCSYLLALVLLRELSMTDARSAIQQLRGKRNA